jgi:acyl carrier protein
LEAFVVWRDQAGVDVPSVVLAANRVLERIRTRHERVGPSTTLEEAGIESLELTEILVELEVLTGAVVSTDDVAAVRTIADIASLPRVFV